MNPKIDGRHLGSTLNVVVFHLILTHSCRGQFQLIGSPRPILAAVGEDTVLPCHLKPAIDVTAETLEWTRSDLNPSFVHVLRAGQDLVNTRNPSYRGRTSLFVNELKNGNVSLKLSKVKLSDEGTYKCYIAAVDKQSFIKLVVASDAAALPVISLAGIDTDRRGVILQCESKGWYPEPEVLWLDSEGNLLSAGPTETVRGPDDLYTVSSRVTVEKRHSNNITCRVQQRNINQIRETLIYISDDFRVKSSFVTIGLAVSLAISILCILCLVIFVWKSDCVGSKIKTTASQEDETDGGEMKTCCKTKNTEDQCFLEDDREQDQLVTGQTVVSQMPQKNEKVEKKTKHSRQDVRQAQSLQCSISASHYKEMFEEEKQKREETENKIQVLEQELKTVQEELREEMQTQMEKLTKNKKKKLKVPKLQKLENSMKPSKGQKDTSVTQLRFSTLSELKS